MFIATKIVVCLIAALICGGGAGRGRGAHHDNIGTTTGRILFWAAPSGLFTWCLFPAELDLPYQFFYLIALIVAYWLGVAIIGWGELTDLNDPQDYQRLAVRGILVTIFPAIVLSHVSPFSADAIAFTGAAIAPAYALGKKMPTVATWLNKGQEWGEVFTGAAVWSSIMIVAIVRHFLLSSF